MPSAELSDVTFFLTDVEGSTQLWERAPDQMSRALARHDAILSREISNHGGQVVKSRGEGDSIFAVFASPADAAAAALRVQLALSNELWPLGASLKVRIAIHTGPAELRSGDYYGPIVNRCARLRAIGHGGQVLLSAAARDLTADALPPDIALIDLGYHRLKDLARPEHVWQLCHADLAREFPPLASLDPRRHNFPVLLTNFVGRQVEVAEVAALLSRHRLVTLTGTGGVGKTRLALQVSAEVFDDFADGAYLVELAALPNPELVPQALASVLGVREEPGLELAETLAGFLASRHVFLLLDNCEHLVGACAKLAEKLLVAAPELRILATSREPLGISGEVVYRVPSMAAPPADPSPESVSQSEAVQLFVDRATLATRRVSLTSENSAAVGEICRRLDGIPLAIELAAARTNVLTPNQIAERLHDRFALLTGGSRTALPRQQTLRATVDWSYELLGEPEQTLLQSLSVFSGGFTLEAAEAVCASELEDLQILDLISALVDKSLVVVEDQLEEPRYSMLESIRQYAAEKLDTAREPELRSAHLEWFLALAERGDAERSGPEQAIWLDRLDAEHDNFRSALATEAGRADDRRLALAAALGHFWDTRGHWTEGRRWLEAVIADAAAGRSRARAVRLIAVLALSQGDYTLARDRAEGALATFREIRDRGGAANCLCDLGSVALGQGDLPGARALFEEALATFRAIGDRRGAANCTVGLGRMAHVQGDYLGARTRCEEALATFREIGDRAGVATCTLGLGVMAFVQGDFVGARTRCEESLATFREIGDRAGAARCLQNLGNLAHHQGDYAGALALHEEALATFREIGDRAGAAGCLGGLGVVSGSQGDYAGARAFHEEALATFREIGDRAGAAGCLGILGDVARSQGDYPGARAFYEEGRATHREIGNRTGAAGCLNGLGNLAYHRGDYPGARAMFEEAVAMLREIGDRLSVPYGLNNLGLVAQMQGDYRGARALYEEALASFHEIEDRAGVALCLDNLGRLSRVEGNGQLALENLWEALSLSRDLGLKSIAIDCVEVLAGLIGERGDGARAARLLGAAEALQEVVGLPHEAPEKPDYDRDVSLVRGLLDEDAFARAWDEGRGMTLEQATAYALEADDDPGAGGTVSEPDA